jgi:hypothetical protein
VNSSRKNNGLSKARMVLCLTLAFLFLYNPFLGMASSSGGLNIRHSASYRATVGASELQHFSPTNARKIFAMPLAALFTWLELPIQNIVCYSFKVSRRPQYVDQFLYADSWFRPPPTM